MEINLYFSQFLTTQTASEDVDAQNIQLFCYF